MSKLLLLEWNSIPMIQTGSKGKFLVFRTDFCKIPIQFM
jgi:hypothetical protein